MTDLKKRIFDALGRVLRFMTANPDLFEKAGAKKAPSVTVTQTRETLTNTRTTKKVKGERA